MRKLVKFIVLCIALARPVSLLVVREITCTKTYNFIIKSGMRNMSIIHIILLKIQF